MDVLEKGKAVPEIELKAKSGETINPARVEGPLVLVFFHPVVLASRHVVGYLRRLPAMASGVPIWFVSTATPEETEVYVQGYLEDFPVVLEGCEALRAFGGRFVPATYFLKDGKVDLAFTGFHKLALNTLGRRAAELAGKRAKDLVTEADNKGEYELAEPAPCAS